MVVNTSFRLVPWADVLYACDGEWWDEYIGEVRRSFKGELWAYDRQASKNYGLNQINGRNAPGLGKDQVYTGGNGGYQAINLAYLFGAVRIVLLGFDMQYGADGKVHWHGNHPGNLNRACPVRSFARNFPQLASDLAAEGVEVVNATRETALECFPKTRLEEALCTK